MESNIVKHFITFSKRKLFRKEVAYGVLVLCLVFFVHYGLGIKFYKLGNPTIGSIVFYGLLSVVFGFILSSGRKGGSKEITIVFVLLSVVQVFPMHKLLMTFFPWYAIQFVAAISNNIKVIVFFLLIPLIYAKFWFEPPLRFRDPIKPLPTPWMSYLLILLGMSALIFWAAGLPDFQTMYPRYKSGYLESSSSWTYTQSLLVYESTYALQFVAIEYFFRSFLLRLFSKSYGNLSVVLATVLYVLIHFTKPFPEALGSAFGGLALCFLVIRTHSIKGGLILHLGVALLMEIFAYLRSS